MCSLRSVSPASPLCDSNQAAVERVSEERRKADREAKQRMADLVKEELRESHEEEKRKSALHCPRHHRSVNATTALPSSLPESVYARVHVVC